MVLIALFAGWLYSRTRGPHHQYELDLLVPPAGAAITPGRLEIGVAKRSIAPDLSQYDPWVDVNSNGEYDEGVDTYTDLNGNGKFDGVWIAGFGTNRPATGIHDDPEVRVLALRNNGVTLVLASLDSVGIFHNDFIDIRKSLDPGLKIDHVALSSTHVHEVPDTMKIWSYAFRLNIRGKKLDVPIWGFDYGHLEMIKRRTKEAIEEAVAKLQPCDMYCATVEIKPEGFVNDSRDPQVLDNNMYLFRFTRPGTEDTIATFVNWGNHPETLGGDNTIITADFPHFLRKGMEEGVSDPNGVAGFGGMCLYFQGIVGGLMTQLHTTVPHRDGLRSFREASFEKADALGSNLAIVACKALRNPDLVWKNENPRVQFAAKTYKAPLQGQFKYGIMLGVIHEGYYWGGKAKTEVNCIRIGDVLVLTVPGEIYPEIVVGGVEAKPGRDFEIAPVEVPPLKEFMNAKARMSLTIGLCNDQIGYIVPKSQWDTKPPYVYRNKPQYGEINSGGPDVAPAVHAAGRELIERINAAW
jgi:hypothetical protein